MNLKSTFVVLLAASAILGAAIPAHAEEVRSTKVPELVTGAACKRNDGAAGIVKRDACKRWYCGLASIKDPIDVIPDIDKRANCTWQIVGQQCRCVRNAPK